MSKPCGHDDDRREPGCRVCELYATDAAYKALWDGTPAESSAESSAGPCRHRGDPLAGWDRHRLGLSMVDWAPCGHPAKPMGDYACPCSGCGPKCAGFEGE